MMLPRFAGRVFGGVHAGLRPGERKALVARGGATGVDEDDTLC